MSGHEHTETVSGFCWGPCEVIREVELPDGRIVLGIKANGRKRLEIYMSTAGRSVHVFDNQGRELTA